MGYAEVSKCKNRHMEFIQNIFVDISEGAEPEKMEDLATTLDDLLARIFDEEG